MKLTQEEIAKAQTGVAKILVRLAAGVHAGNSGITAEAAADIAVKTFERITQYTSKIVEEVQRERDAQ